MYELNFIFNIKTHENEHRDIPKTHTGHRASCGLTLVSVKSVSAGTPGPNSSLGEVVVLSSYSLYS